MEEVNVISACFFSILGCFSVLEIRVRCPVSKLLAECSESVADNMNRILIIIIIIIIISIITVIGYCFQLRMPCAVRFLQT